MITTIFTELLHSLRALRSEVRGPVARLPQGRMAAQLLEARPGGLLSLRLALALPRSPCDVGPRGYSWLNAPDVAGPSVRNRDVSRRANIKVWIEGPHPEPPNSLYIDFRIFPLNPGSTPSNKGRIEQRTRHHLPIHVPPR